MMWLTANLETGGEGVILQLVGETLTQRLAGPGVVRQAKVTTNLRTRIMR